MIIIRKSVEEDILEIYRNIHLDYVKKYSIDEKSEWERHKRWYIFLINSPTYSLYTLENEYKNFLGTVKFELKKDEAIINIYLVKKIRGKGYSKKIINLSIEELVLEKKEIKKIGAYILEENDISKKAFDNSGFLYVGKKDFMGTEYLYYMKNV